ncbi:unnamed protein product, partial [Ectocarpus sp. 12 AP-2014]
RRTVRWAFRCRVSSVITVTLVANTRSLQRIAGVTTKQNPTVKPITCGRAINTGYFLWCHVARNAKRDRANSVKLDSCRVVRRLGEPSYFVDSFSQPPKDSSNIRISSGIRKVPNPWGMMKYHESLRSSSSFIGGCICAS